MRYSHIKNAAKKAHTGTISLDDLQQGRFYHEKLGWTNLKIVNIEFDDLQGKIGCRKGLYSYLNANLGSLPKRIMYHPEYGWSYTAGQDYNAEIKLIQREIRRVL